MAIERTNGTTECNIFLLYKLMLIVKIVVMFWELKVKCIGSVGICNNISFNTAQVIAVEQSLGS